MLPRILQVLEGLPSGKGFKPSRKLLADTRGAPSPLTVLYPTLLSAATGGDAGRRRGAARYCRHCRRTTGLWCHQWCARRTEAAEAVPGAVELAVAGGAADSGRGDAGEVCHVLAGGTSRSHDPLRRARPVRVEHLSHYVTVITDRSRRRSLPP